jgi:hypothetical protein
MLRLLSLGAGVQSSALLLMSIQGVLPRIDAAIFADTQWEPSDVYDHLRWLEEEAKAAGISIHHVTAGNLRTHAIDGVPKANGGLHYTFIPITVRVSGTAGVGRVRERQCTRDYKVRPILKRPESWLG